MSLISEARALLDAEELDPDGITALAARALAEADQLDQPSGEQVVALLGELIAAAEASQRRMQSQLDELAGGRRAVRGYGQIRATRRGQRCDRNV